MPDNPLILLFTTVYFFSFRDSAKTAAAWRAFSGEDLCEKFLKFILLSCVLLILVPVALFAVFLKWVGCISLSDPTPFFIAFLEKIPPVLFVGFFPRVTKNAWALIVTKQSGCAQKRDWTSWIYKGTDSNTADRPLPTVRYAWQVVGSLGAIPLLWLWYVVPGCPTAIGWKDGAVVLLPALYISQMAVLFYMAKERGLGYPEKRPTNLLNWKLSATFVCDIALPSVFAIFWYAWLVGLTRLDHIGIASGFTVAMCTGFPYCCHNGLFLFARMKSWVTSQEMGEGYQILFTILGFVMLSILWCVIQANPGYLAIIVEKSKSIRPGG